MLSQAALHASPAFSVVRWSGTETNRCRPPSSLPSLSLLARPRADVISIEKSGEHFRLLYDVKGRFAIHRISEEEATYKLLKVRKVQLGAKGVPFIVTHDGRTIRYPDPAIKVNDVVKFDLVENKIVDHVKFEQGNVRPPLCLSFSLGRRRRRARELTLPPSLARPQLVMLTGGRNQGRVGTIVHRERHLGGYDIVRPFLPRSSSLARTLADSISRRSPFATRSTASSPPAFRTSSSSGRATSLSSRCPRVCFRSLAVVVRRPHADSVLSSVRRQGRQALDRRGAFQTIREIYH